MKEEIDLFLCVHIEAIKLLDFHYKIGVRPNTYGAENELQLVPLKSEMVTGKRKNKKTISQVVYIEN